MSQPNFEASAPSVLTKKSPWNVYTVMLIVSLLALLIACLCLWMEIREYGGFGAIKGPQASVTAPARGNMAALSGNWA
ncbi:MAG: hypothetical protein CMJ58_06565 [Planctomycetaceae bacterium]|nr:hypothetical protein [Planctomycetaceae bacterium]